MSFNPSSPRAIGNEYLPYGIGQSVLQTEADQVTVIVRSNATETIDHLRVGHFWPGAQNVQRRMYADIYAASNTGVADVETTHNFVPNETTFNPTIGDPQLGALAWRGTTDNGATFAVPAASVHTVLDDSNDNDWVQQASTAVAAGTDPNAVIPGQMLGLRFTSSTMPTGRRVLAVYFDIRGYHPPLSRVSLLNRIDLYRSGTRIATVAQPSFPFSLGGFLAPGNWPTVTVGPLYLNPETQLPWSVTDIQAFDTTYEFRLGVVQAALRISAVTMRVVSVPERRVAWGWGTPERFVSTGVEYDPATLRSDMKISLQHTDTAGDDWLKTTGTDYYVVLRRLGYHDPIGGATRTAVGVPSVRWWVGLAENPARDGQLYAAHANASGRLLAVNYLSGLAVPLWPIRTDNAMSVDSFPYHSLDIIPVHTTAGFVARQSFTAVDARTYATIRAVVGYQPGAPPNASLRGRIVRQSDSVVMGGEGSLTLTDFVALPQKSWASAAYPNMRMAEVAIQLSTAATLTAGVAYWIEFASGSTSGYWLVPSMRADNPVGVTGDVSAPGAGSTSTSGVGDLMTVVLDRPAPVGTFTATVGSDAVASPGEVSGCTVGTAPKVTLAWSVTTLGSLFSHYEIQRADRPGVWNTISRQYAEGTTTFVDREMPSNVAVSYRIRVVRGDGGISVFATSAAVTPVQSLGTVQLASNRLGYTLGFIKVGGEDDWTFPTSGQAELREMWGRDYSVALRPTEVVGASYSVAVLIWVGRAANPPAGQGRAAYDPLRAMVESTAVPYLAVRQPDGEVTYANVVLADGHRNKNSNMYVASLLVRQTSGVPVPV